MKALVIRTAGTNCDAELCRAFELAGATPELVHLDQLIRQPTRIDSADLIGFPGGFSYGDDIASGRIFAMRVREHLWCPLHEAASRSVPMIGICNGFQILVQVGLLPGAEPNQMLQSDAPPPQRASLARNASGRFIDQWIGVEVNPESPCIWTGSLKNVQAHSDLMMLPIAHAEGRFTASANDIELIENAGQVALRYTSDINGSANRIAGICDATGRIFGLMPHPERYVDWLQHPFWTRLDSAQKTGETPGMKMFRDAVEAAGVPA